MIIFFLRVASNGMSCLMQVCTICYKSIPQKQSLFGSSVTSEVEPTATTPTLSQPSVATTPTPVAKSPDIRFRPYELSRPSPSPKVSSAVYNVWILFVIGHSKKTDIERKWKLNFSYMLLFRDMSYIIHC
jgi:hypothetical protein